MRHRIHRASAKLFEQPEASLTIVVIVELAEQLRYRQWWQRCGRKNRHTEVHRDANRRDKGGNDEGVRENLRAQAETPSGEQERSTKRVRTL